MAALKSLVNTSSYRYGITVGQPLSDTVTYTGDTSSSSNMTTGFLHDNNDILRNKECESEFATCQIQQHLFLIVGPILFFISTVGNGLALAVMTRKSLKNTATAVFISCLAVSDTVAVWTGLTRHFIYKLIKYDIRQYSIWACRFQRFFLYVSLDTSAWILAAVTIERFLAVCAPQRHAMIKKSSSAWLIVLGIVIFQTLFNMQVFFTYGKQEVPSDNMTEVFQCGFSSKSARTYITQYHGYIALAVYSVIPFLIMLTLNIFIIQKLQEMRKGFQNRNLSTKSVRKHANSVSITKMLLTVTFYFIAVSTPTFIYTLVQSKVLNTTSLTPEQYAKSEIIDAVCTLMLYLNHSLNFLMYCVSGRRFRRKLIEMLSCNGRVDMANTTMTSKSINKKSTEEISTQFSLDKEKHKPEQQQILVD